LFPRFPLSHLAPLLSLSLSLSLSPLSFTCCVRIYRQENALAPLRVVIIQLLG
jgi:hypothetical protein